MLDVSATNGPMSLYNVSGKLTAHVTNGPVTAKHCDGDMEIAATNGPITVEEASGKQNIHTQNGPITLTLDGTRYNGDGLDVHATNGPVTVKVPSGFQSGVVIQSDGHGPFSCRAEVCSQGRKTWDEDVKRIEFGSGPAVIRVSTVNGPLAVR